MISLYLGTRKLCPLAPFLFHIGTELLAAATRPGWKKAQIVKKEIKLPLFTDDMIVFVENPKESMKKTRKNK